MKFGIVICSRPDSTRVPNKPFVRLGGRAVIEHLVRRLSASMLPIYVAVPSHREMEYHFLEANPRTCVFDSHHCGDPLARTLEVAEAHGLDAVVRVTHDKIFVRADEIIEARKIFEERGLDYLYGSRFVPGCAFEIISKTALREASEKYKNVEHISYAIRNVTENSYDFNARHPIGNYRLLIDFHEDVKLMELLFARLGPDCTVQDVIKYLNVHSEMKEINRLPQVTIYTCVYNGAKYIERAMRSVVGQADFKRYEYVIVDDGSTDETLEIVAAFALKHPNIRWIRNEKNIGLASSSNVAISGARGKYVMRLDADDYFVPISAVQDMVKFAERRGHEAVYPDNFFGSLGKIQKGSECRHAGGALFDRTALNFIKFTDGLRGHDSLDLFLRARDRLKVGYYDKPTFLYTQRPDSLSKTNKVERAKIKRMIEREASA